MKNLANHDDHQAHDDPRLTAYVLGELDARERAAVEALLARSPEARAAAADLAALGEQLRRELAEEVEPGLDPARRRALDAALSGGRARPGTASGHRAGPDAASKGRARPGSLVRLWLPAAAAVLLGTFTWRSLWPDESAQERGAPRPAGAAAEVLGEPLPSASVAQVDGDDAAARRTRDELGYLGGETRRGEDGAARDTGTQVPPEVRQTAAGSASLEKHTQHSEDAPDLVAAGEPLSPATPSGRSDEAGVAGGAGPQGHRVGKLGRRSSPAAAIDGFVFDQALGYVGYFDNPASTPRAPAAAAEVPLVSHGASEVADRRQAGKPSAGAAYRTRPSGGESYAPIVDNPFVPLTADPTSALSTFGVDVDTASYSNVRRFLHRGERPPRDAVRLEELLNHFDYGDPEPQGEVPFSVAVEAASAPWAPAHRLVRVGLRGRTIALPERPASNLVFLLDVSGSMSSHDKLPLLVASVKLLLQQLDERDKVALVTYADGSQLVLPSTPCSERATIEAVLDGLSANGSTHASAGIQLAYEVAAKGFLPEGTNRVLLATDGDFNVGITGEGDLERFIAEKAEGGVFLTVLGFGTGNLQDSKAEILADRGNGHYAYIDSLAQAHEVLVAELSGTLITIAKDVKVQVEFNPGRVAAYRLLGYENRALAAADFRNDEKDAGEIGAGHTVTALYEVVPVGVTGLTGTAELRYQRPPPAPEVLVESDELLTVNLRYKLPDGDQGHELAVPLRDGGAAFEAASADLRFAAAVAAFGMILRDSPHRGDADCARVAEWAAGSRGTDPDGERSEFVRLVRVAQGLIGS